MNFHLLANQIKKKKFKIIFFIFYSRNAKIFLSQILNQRVK